MSVECETRCTPESQATGFVFIGAHLARHLSRIQAGVERCLIQTEGGGSGFQPVITKIGGGFVEIVVVFPKSALAGRAVTGLGGFRRIGCDDGKIFQPAEIKAGEAFLFRFEIYQFGWLKLPYFNGYRTYKLMHGKDYSILWNRRSKNWTLVEVPN